MKVYPCLWCSAPFTGGPGYCSHACMRAGVAEDRKHCEPDCTCGVRPDGGPDYRMCGKHS